jgi:hypothetical protein
MKQDIKKMQGGSEAPMTRLKELWREMPEVERDEWRDLFVSNLPSVEIREKIMAKLHIPLPRDSQLCRFRDWAEKEREQEELVEGLAEDVLFFEKRFGTDEASAQARKKMLACSYARALRRGNYGDVLRTMRADCRDRRLDLTTQTTAHRLADGQVKALELCLDDSKKYPEVVEMFQQAFAALREAKGPA